MLSVSRKEESVRNKYRQESGCHNWCISGRIIIVQRAREMSEGVEGEA